jgi:hypothetical protein
LFAAYKAADYFRQDLLDEQSALMRRQAQFAAHRLIQVIPRDRFSSLRLPRMKSRLTDRRAVDEL